MELKAYCKSYWIYPSNDEWVQMDFRNPENDRYTRGFVRVPREEFDMIWRKLSINYVKDERHARMVQGSERPARSANNR